MMPSKFQAPTGCSIGLAAFGGSDLNTRPKLILFRYEEAKSLTVKSLT